MTGIEKSYKRARWFWFQVSENKPLLYKFWNKLKDNKLIDFAYAQFKKTEKHGLQLRGYAYNKKRLTPNTLKLLFKGINHTYGNLFHGNVLSEYIKKNNWEIQNKINNDNYIQFDKTLPTCFVGQIQNKRDNDHFLQFGKEPSIFENNNDNFLQFGKEPSIFDRYIQFREKKQ